jgi:hypothetical protein
MIDRTQTAHIDSRMSRCVWFGGQDWVGPHLVVGRLVLGHTEPKAGAGGGRQVIMRTAPHGCVSRLLGQAPTQILCDVLEMFERLSRDKAFEAAHDLCCVLPFVTSSGDIRFGSGVS